MQPPQREFERIPVDDFINAEIVDIIYDSEHEFNSFGSNEKEVHSGVQFVFSIVGLEHKKKSRWFKFSYDERSNLYKLFVAPLVDGAMPYMQLDLDQLKGMQIRMLWKNDKDPRYQSIETVRPVGKKVVPLLPQGPQPILSSNDEEVPF